MAKLLRKISKTAPKAPHISIRALAGTGKTTTICWGFNGVPDGYQVSDEQKPIISAIQSEKFKSARFTAFSKAIATELESRLPSSVQACTNHSLGKATLYKAFGRHKVSGYKTFNICEDLYGPVKNAKNVRETSARYNEIRDIVSIAKGCLAGNDDCFGTGEYSATPEQIANVASFYSIDFTDSTIQQAIEVLKVSYSRTDWIDFDDMIAMNALHGTEPEVVDLGVIDEVQDTNKAQQWLATHSCRRLATVGDINQSIFGFAGADPTSIPNLESWMNDTPRGFVTYPLTETRRCAKLIVQEAQLYVPEFRAHPSNPLGIVDSIKDTEAIKQLSIDYQERLDVAVLCRTNAPLTRLALGLLKQKIPVVIRGRKFAEDIIRTIEKFNVDTVKELLVSLEEYEALESGKLMASNRPDRDEKLVNLEDKCIVIRIFCDGCRNVVDVIQRFNEIFSDENKKNCITLCSGHRSKGLEWHKVFIYRPELFPHPKIAEKSEFNRVQENNLAYVAKTRAKFHLCYITTTKLEGPEEDC